MYIVRTNTHRIHHHNKKVPILVLFKSRGVYSLYLLRHMMMRMTLRLVLLLSNMFWRGDDTYVRMCVCICLPLCHTNVHVYVQKKHTIQKIPKIFCVDNNVSSYYTAVYSIYALKNTTLYDWYYWPVVRCCTLSVSRTAQVFAADTIIKCTYNTVNYFHFKI